MRRILLVLVLAHATVHHLTATESVPLDGPQQNQHLGLVINACTKYGGGALYTDLIHLAAGCDLIAAAGAPPLASGEALPVDGQGWPTAIPSGRAARIHILSSPVEDIPTEPMLVLWRGQGSFNDGTLQFVAGAITPLPDADGFHRAILTPAPRRPLMLTIARTDAGDHIRDVHLIRSGFWDTWQTRTWMPAAADLWRHLRVFRALGHINTNGMCWQLGLNPYAGQRFAFADFTAPDHPFWGGVRGTPIAALIDLANEADVDLWLPLPVECSDACIRDIAQLCRQRLKPHLRPYIEYGNEVWNSGGIFGSGYWYTRWVGQQLMGLTDAQINADWKLQQQARIRGQGEQSLRWWGIFDEVYGSTSTTRKPFVRILSSQASVPFYLAFYKEWWDARAASLGVRPRDLLDGFGIAPYVGFSPAIGWDKANHVLTEGTPSWREVADAWTVDQIIDRLRDSGQPATDSYITRHLGGTPGTYTWLPGGRMPGLVEDDIPLVAYEHGVSLTFRNSEYVTNATILADCGITPSQATELKATAKRLTDKIFAASRHPRMAEVVRWTIDNWQQRTGGTQMCYFMSVGALHPVNTFGLLEYVDQRQDILKPPYKYHAVLDWANSGAGRRTNLPPQLAATAVATLAATDTAIPVSVTDDDATRLATLISWTSPDGLGILACEPGTVRIRAPVPGDYTLVGIADDGAARSRLVLAVHADPRPPVLDVPATATMGAGRELLIPIALAWSDGDPAAIDLAARSQDTGLLPSGYLAIQGTGTQRTLVVRAASTASGTARIAITARVPTATISADLTVTITPVAPLPGVAVIGDLLADEDAGVALVPVSRIGGTAGRLEADVTVHDIASATIGSDVGNASATLVWEDGDASPRSLAVPLIADGTPEPTETVAIRLVAQRGARYASYRPAGTLTIRDTDAGRIAFTTVVAQVTEGERTVLLKVRRSRGRTGPLHATWRTLETPSAEPWQFDAAAGDLAWDDGVDGDRTIPIRIHASSAVTPLGVVPVDVSLTSTVGRVEVGRTAIVITDAQAHTLTSPWSRSGMGWNPTGGDALERDGLLELAMSGVLGWTQDGGQAVLRPAGAADAMETSILGFSGEPTAWAGVQWRSDATGMAPTVMLTVDASGQTRWSVRDTASGVLVTRNGPSAPIPAILRLERLGDRISGFANETRVGACDFAPAGAAAGCIGLVGSSQTSGFGTWSRALVQLAPTAVGGGG